MVTFVWAGGGRTRGDGSSCRPTCDELWGALAKWQAVAFAFTEGKVRYILS